MLPALRFRHVIPRLLVALCAAAPALAAQSAHAEPAGAAARHFPDATRVALRVHPALVSGGCAPRFVLPRSDVRVWLGRSGDRLAWRMRAGGRTLGSAPSRPHRPFSLDLDADAGTVSARAGRTSLVRRARLQPERSVQIRLGPGRRCRASGVRITTTGRSSTAAPAPKPAGIFAADSVWNQALAPDAALDSRSALYVSDLQRQVGEYSPYVNTTRYSTPVFTVGGEQPTVRVQLDEVALANPLLVHAWERVPIPPGARPAAGSDQHMVIWQPSTDTMWEFWRASRQSDGWHARYGGRMEHVSANPGYFTSPPGWGATATSLPLLGGLIRLDELAAGHIDHALALAIPQARAHCFSWPAQRTDGSLDAEDAIPEGARFRIDPRVDLARAAMSPLVRMLAEAAQRYGMVVRDGAGAVTFYAEDPTPTGTDPYLGPNGYFGSGNVQDLLRREFPWQDLQALRTQLSCR
jgi:hypothetical protein